MRNVPYKGYQTQVMNEYYFEDGGRISGGLYYPAGSQQGEKLDLPPGKVTPGVTGVPLSRPVVSDGRSWRTAM